jgi:hypothetical protein
MTQNGSPETGEKRPGEEPVHSGRPTRRRTGPQSATENVEGAEGPSQIGMDALASVAAAVPQAKGGAEENDGAPAEEAEAQALDEPHVVVPETSALSEDQQPVTANPGLDVIMPGSAEAGDVMGEGPTENHEGSCVLVFNTSGQARSRFMIHICGVEKPIISSFPFRALMIGVSQCCVYPLLLTNVYISRMRRRRTFGGCWRGTTS